MTRWKSLAFLTAVAAVFMLTTATAAGQATLEELVKNLNLDISKDQISVSGISSGGFMAHQFHVAHSANLMGAGIIAGGPYYCAEGIVYKGMMGCTAFASDKGCAILKKFNLGWWCALFLTKMYKIPGIAPPYKEASDEAINMANKSIEATITLNNQNKIDDPIDDPKELLGDKIILIHGVQDTLLPEGVMDALDQYYQGINVHFGRLPKTNLVYLKTLPITHAMPTDNFIGLPAGKIRDCQAQPDTPFLNVCTQKNCQENCCQTGLPCSDLSCLKQCNTAIDAAGAILTHIYGPPDPQTHIPGPLNPRCQENQDRPGIPLCSEIKVKDWGRYNVPPTVEQHCQKGSGSDPRCQWLQRHLFTFYQSKDLLNSSYLSTYGFLFVPPQCNKDNNKGTEDKKTPCKLHIVFHGCLQGFGGPPIEQAIYNMGWTHFVENAGYNEWANTNDIVVLYPQASTGNTIPYTLYGNPQGCWDFWGYTGANYHTKEGRQISAVWDMVKKLVPDLN